MRPGPLSDDPNYRRGRQGRPWRRIRAHVLARSRMCWICGHDESDSVDHLTPLSRGGAPLDLNNLAPAHDKPCPTCARRCNTARGNKLGPGTTQRNPGSRTNRTPEFKPTIIRDLRW